MTSFLTRMGILGELFAYLWRRKLYWLIPMMVTLIAVAALIILGSSSGSGFFIYTIF